MTPGRLPRRFNVLTNKVEHLMGNNRRVKYVGFPANPVTAIYEIPARIAAATSSFETTEASLLVYRQGDAHRDRQDAATGGAEINKSTSEDRQQN
jgi:hypothetical protein